MLLVLSSFAAAFAADPLIEADAAGLRPVETSPEIPSATVLITDATVMTASGSVFAPGWIWWRDGRIGGVGDGPPPQVESAQILAMPGRFVTPGIIDTHSHLGVYASPEGRAHQDGNEMTDPVTAGVWAEHSVDPQDPGFVRALAGGVTTLQVLPGSGNLIGGRGVILHNRPARGARAMRLPGAPATLKMACGENPKRVYGDKGRAPSTRMGNVRGQREAFLDAIAYRDAWRAHARALAAWESRQDAHAAWEVTGSRRGEPEAAGDPPTPPSRDLDLETLVGVLDGRVLPQVHCYTAPDMLAMLQVADEFGFSVRSFHHAIEAYKIRDVLAAEGVAVSTWADWWGFKLEAYDAIPENAALVHEAGGRAIVHSDSPIGIQRLNQEAGKALAAGRAAGVPLSDDDALRWITANPAWALGVDDQIGTLDVGKRADVVAWSRSPFSVYAVAERVWVDGAAAWSVADPPPGSDFELGVKP